MKESKKELQIISESNIFPHDQLLPQIEESFVEDDSWEIGEPCIFNITKTTDTGELIVEKYEITVNFTPYFSVETKKL